MDHGSFKDGYEEHERHHHWFLDVLWGLVLVDGIRRSPGLTLGEKTVHFARIAAFLALVMVLGWVALGFIAVVINAVLGI